MPRSSARSRRPWVVEREPLIAKIIVEGTRERNGSADLGLIAGPVKADGLEVIHASTDRLLLALPHGHPLCESASITLKDTLDFPHVVFHEGCTLFDFVSAQVEQMGATLPMRIQLSSYESIFR